MPKLLSDGAIREQLGKLHGWSHRGEFIVKTFKFASFREGVRFLNAVANIAEAYQHHPDIKVRYTTITLSVQTHSEGGVTAWDIGLARRIEHAVSGSRKKR